MPAVLLSVVEPFPEHLVVGITVFSTYSVYNIRYTHFSDRLLSLSNAFTLPPCLFATRSFLFSAEYSSVV